jgi:hypothetical protein
MCQPVKLSDALVLDARLTAELAERSIAGQIEFWARIGRAVEPLLRGDKALALRKSGDQVPLSELLRSVELPEGRQRVTDYLKLQPFPHYEPAPERPGWLVRIEEDGTRSIGRFVNRELRSWQDDLLSRPHRVLWPALRKCGSNSQAA